MDEDLQPDPPLTAEQTSRVAKLSDEDVLRIDAALLANACHQNRKVAAVVGYTLMELRATIPNVPDIYYAQRVRELVQRGALVADGNLSYMRYSEVRLPGSDTEIDAQVVE